MSDPSSPFGQCIKPTNSITLQSNNHTTATDVLDFATKVAVTTSTTAVKAIDNTKVLPSISSRNRNNSGNNYNYNDKQNDQVVWIKIDDSLKIDMFSKEVLEKLYGKEFLIEKQFEGSVRRPVLIYIGYNIGYAIWVVSVESDSAYELVSVRTGPVNHVNVVSTPTFYWEFIFWEYFYFEWKFSEKIIFNCPKIENTSNFNMVSKINTTYLTCFSIFQIF